MTALITALSVLGSIWLDNLNASMERTDENQLELIRIVSNAVARLDVHLDGHPGRVEEKVRQLEKDLSNMGSDIRVMREIMEIQAEGENR